MGNGLLYLSIAEMKHLGQSDSKKTKRSRSFKALSDLTIFVGLAKLLSIKQWKDLRREIPHQVKGVITPNFFLGTSLSVILGRLLMATIVADG